MKSKQSKQNKEKKPNKKAENKKEGNNCWSIQDHRDDLKCQNGILK